MSSLYLCYQSLLEPLTQTQVVAYLEGLAQAGYTLVLLTFEPRALTKAETNNWRIRMAQKGIAWHWVRYHKSPTVPATMWDVSVGIVIGMRLVQRYNVRLVHARSHVPGLIALALKRLRGIKLLFDIRGFMGEEYVDAGVWRANGLLFRSIKRAERVLVGKADGIVVLTGKARDLLELWYPVEMQGKPIQVIPCCVDLRQVPWDDVRERQSTQNGNLTLVYVGKLGGWYLDEQLAEFIATARLLIPNIKWQVWTQSDPTFLRQVVARLGIDKYTTIGQLSPEELAIELPKAAAGLSFIKPCLSKLASSPTKIGEYLAAGLPVVSTAGIGDVDALLDNRRSGSNGAVGVLVKDLSESSYTDAAHGLRTLLEDPIIRQRCRAVAEDCLDLERVGWQRYREIYQRLLSNSGLQRF